MKAGIVDKKEPSALGAEIESVQNRMQRLKEQQTERAMWEKRVEELRDYLIEQEEELRDYLIEQEEEIAKFNEELFRRFVEKVMIQSIAEVAFVFKVGVEVREVL